MFTEESGAHIQGVSKLSVRNIKAGIGDFNKQIS